MLKGKRVLVTGGTGSIGREIVRQLLNVGAAVVRILSRDDSKQAIMAQTVNGENVRYLLGDVRDIRRLRRAMEGIDVVFHCAALKHVPACEFNPFEAVATNIQGTQNVIDVALEVEAEKVILVSTDKAVNPSNVMGATKLLAERLMIAANNYRGERKTRFSCVRFGNVLGSRGSVVHIVVSQIARGGPVTVTDPHMTRYVMAVEDAVQLVFAATAMMRGGEIFVLKMPRVRVMDLVEVIIEEFAPKFGYQPKEIQIEIIGRRPGEKRDEELVTEDERKRLVEVGSFFVIPPEVEELDSERAMVDNRENGRPEVLKHGELLPKEAVRKLVRRAGLRSGETGIIPGLIV
ncbi:polysaccharide biosynthesis protein [Thermaerobacter sp. PB12/4term]|uniref:SDR family NAD(P)-dependent oxidoreductase n=1 Tax=Thermaerobacter sp. PB12/4term TaxID=2293838 RepID=UPI000E328C02|nr:SDR family NAD(P)-dependent oxidoreductase [Thermaerobacter sp. PB12/4term]QIA26700.1 polysaccharide biosynthesis protein [Thermaerobacter sp. PB12/4term]